MTGLKNYPFVGTRRINGPHIMHTEAETLDEALEIIKGRQRPPRLIKLPSLKAQFASNQNRQRCRLVTVSTGVIAAKVRAPAAQQKADVVWTRQQVIAAHATGHFKQGELAKRAKVGVLQILFWLYKTDRQPMTWKCSVCGFKVILKTEFCPGCGKVWHTGLKP